jgi:predicted dehydrogenase
MVLDATRLADEKNLSIVSGFCWRYHSPKREAFGKVLQGAVGNISAVYNTFNTGALWLRDVKPGWTSMQKKMRNWLYYRWISGDHIVEQGVHTIDMASWVMGDIMPQSAVGTGGRQVRTGPEYGNIFDHFAIVYEYENGTKAFHFSRQQKDTRGRYAVDILGTEGRCLADCGRRRHIIEGKENWQFSGEENNMYQQEHDELFASIRKHKPVNDGAWMARSTMLAVMGRMVAYTGKQITFDEAFNSVEKLGPNIVDYDTEFEEAPVAMPGITKFS